MQSRTTAVILLALGFTAGLCASGLLIPSSHAQSGPRPPDATAFDRNPAFPHTENPDVARSYATAWIVGEAIRSGIVELESRRGETPANALKNLVRDVYEAMK